MIIDVGTLKTHLIDIVFNVRTSIPLRVFAMRWWNVLSSLRNGIPLSQLFCEILLQ